MKMVKTRSDKDPVNFLYTKNWCRDRINSITSKEGPLDRQYEDTILQRLPSEYDKILQTPLGREDC